LLKFSLEEFEKKDNSEQFQKNAAVKYLAFCLVSSIVPEKKVFFFENFYSSTTTQKMV